MRNALAELLFGGTSLICVVAFCLAGRINIQTVFIVYFISGLLVVAVFIYHLDFGLIRPFAFDGQQFRDTLAFAKWIIIGTTAAYFIGWGDNIVLRFLTTIGDIGSYNLGYDFFKGITMAAFLVYSYFLPFVSQHIQDNVKIREYLLVKRPRIILLGLVGVAVCFVIAPYVFRIIYRGAHQDSVTIIRILLVGAVPAFYNIFYDTIFNALKKYRVTQTLTVLQVLLNLILDVILVPLMGIAGAAVAAVVGYASRSVIYEVYYRRYIRRILELAE
jgi:O-antigen/teichoic acid export membrane protein